jgi:hypothetical protein
MKQKLKKQIDFNWRNITSQKNVYLSSYRSQDIVMKKSKSTAYIWIKLI